ncbi:hypothetical protein HGRIS_013349 [Hohenbuehelia grisea]|uniref:Uncharacterized protein n=1 Tax=Hohenbuehelia grisea TaxID=104357 RepID=A0ABR3IVA0_9AGAR
MVLLPTSRTITDTSIVVGDLRPRDGNSSSTVPIGIIVGCTAAGLVLGVAILVGWAIWERATQRKRKANISAATTKQCPPLPQISSPRPRAKVKFVAHAKDSPSRADDEKKFLMPHGGTKEKSAIPRQRKFENGEPDTGSKISLSRSSTHVAKSIAHQPSTISSISAYSTESGEERQAQIGSRFTWNQRRQDRSLDGNRVHPAEQRRPGWVFIPRPLRSMPPSRLSQASSTSAYSQ